jgi:hypothetical protein
VVSFKSPEDMPGMVPKSTAFVPRYQKFESISLQQRVRCEPVCAIVFVSIEVKRPEYSLTAPLHLMPIW